MAADYAGTLRAAVERIARGTAGVAAVHHGWRASEACGAYPAVLYRLRESRGERGTLTTHSERRRWLIQFVLVARPTVGADSPAVIERLEAALRAAFETDNRAGATRAALPGFLGWGSLNITKYQAREGRIASAAAELTATVRRPYEENET